jgi:hypothetical protein
MGTFKMQFNDHFPAEKSSEFPETVSDPMQVDEIILSVLVAVAGIMVVALDLLAWGVF